MFLHVCVCVCFVSWVECVLFCLFVWLCVCISLGFACHGLSVSYLFVWFVDVVCLFHLEFCLFVLVLRLFVCLWWRAWTRASWGWRVCLWFRLFVCLSVVEGVGCVRKSDEW